jgi:hypothetical protein
MSYFSGQVKTIAVIEPSAIDLLMSVLLNETDIWQYWNAVKPNKFDVFESSVEHIVFKYPVNLQSHQVSAVFPLWDDWQHLIQPLIEQATAQYSYKNCGVARIMLAKLLPFSEIPLHVDASSSAELPHKIHIPLQTQNDVVMTFSEGDYHLSVGHAYEVNNRIQHGVSNPTDSERIHLIFDFFEM